MLNGLESYGKLRVDVAGLIEMIRDFFFPIKNLKQLKLRKDLSREDLQFYQSKLENFQLDLTADFHCAIFIIIFIVLIDILVDGLSYDCQLGETRLAFWQLR